MIMSSRFRQKKSSSTGIKSGTSPRKKDAQLTDQQSRIIEANAIKTSEIFRNYNTKKKTSNILGKGEFWFAVPNLNCRYREGFEFGRANSEQTEERVRISKHYDMEGVGGERLELWKMSADDVEELRQQVKRETIHKQTENIMPLVLQMTKDQIEVAYRDIIEQMNIYDIEEMTDEDLDEDSDDDEAAQIAEEDDDDDLTSPIITSDDKQAAADNDSLDENSVSSDANAAGLDIPRERLSSESTQVVSFDGTSDSTRLNYAHETTIVLQRCGEESTLFEADFETVDAVDCETRQTTTEFMRTDVSKTISVHDERIVDGVVRQENETNMDDVHDESNIDSVQTVHDEYEPTLDPVHEKPSIDGVHDDEYERKINSVVHDDPNLDGVHCEREPNVESVHDEHEPNPNVESVHDEHEPNPNVESVHDEHEPNVDSVCGERSLPSNNSLVHVLDQTLPAVNTVRNKGNNLALSHDNNDDDDKSNREQLNSGRAKRKHATVSEGKRKSQRTRDNLDNDLAKSIHATDENGCTVDRNDPRSSPPLETVHVKRQHKSFSFYNRTISRPDQEKICDVPDAELNKNKKDVPDSIRKDVSDPIRKDVSDPIWKDVSDPIRKGVSDPIRKDVSDPMRKGVSDPILKGVSDPIRKDVSDPTQKDVSDPIRKDSVTSLSGEVNKCSKRRCSFEEVLNYDNNDVHKTVKRDSSTDLQRSPQKIIHKTSSSTNATELQRSPQKTINKTVEVSLLSTDNDRALSKSGAGRAKPKLETTDRKHSRCKDEHSSSKPDKSDSKRKLVSDRDGNQREDDHSKPTESNVKLDSDFKSSRHKDDRSSSKSDKSEAKRKLDLNRERHRREDGDLSSVSAESKPKPKPGSDRKSRRQTDDARSPSSKRDRCESKHVVADSDSRSRRRKADRSPSETLPNSERKSRRSKRDRETKKNECKSESEKSENDRSWNKRCEPESSDNERSHQQLSQTVSNSEVPSSYLDKWSDAGFLSDSPENCKADDAGDIDSPDSPIHSPSPYDVQSIHDFEEDLESSHDAQPTPIIIPLTIEDPEMQRLLEEQKKTKEAGGVSTVHEIPSDS